MEENLQAKPVASLTGIATTFLPVVRFIEPLMRSKSIEVLNKVVLQVDDAEAVESLMGYYRNLGTVLDTHASAVKNYQCYMILVSANSKSTILNLLRREDLFLIIIASGIVPSYLSGCCIIQLDTHINNEEAEFLNAEARNFMNYVRKNPCFVLQALDRFLTSIWYTEHKFTSILNISLHAILEAYRAYYRGEHCEADTADWIEILEAGIECIIDRAEGIGYDMLQPIRDLVIEYIETHSEVLLCDIGKIEGKTVKALECEQAILFDDVYYYFPERLFRSMCEPLLKTVAITEIKNRLFNEGYLDRGKGETSGYTVKKVIVLAFGKQLRMRFLKIFREFIVEDGFLTLEERRWERCTSGVSMENEDVMYQEMLSTTRF